MEHNPNYQADSHDPSRSHAIFSDLLAMADSLVPYPWINYVKGLPLESDTAYSAGDFRIFHFVYKCTNDFSCHLSFKKDRKFSEVILLRGHSTYKYQPIVDRTQLITLEAALRQIHRFLEAQKESFWLDIILEPYFGSFRREDEYFKRYSELPFAFFRLEQPFRAGVIEPFYMFSKPALRREIWVGARTGEIYFHNPPPRLDDL